MSISSTVRRAGPFAGSGTVSTFPFPFKVFQPSDVLVVTLNVATGVQTTMVLNTDYTVALNANQDFNPGGTISLANGSLPTGYNLVISSDIPELQGTDLTNQGGFYPEVITNEFDLLTILIQQLQELLDRTISFPITDPTGINTQLPPVAQRANMYLTFDANGNPVTVVAAPGQSSPQTLSFGYLEAESTAAQTEFTTPPYTPGGNNLFVTTGGMTLAVGIDYTETSPNSITLTAPSPAGAIYTFRSILAAGFTPVDNTPYVMVVPYAPSVTLNAGLADGFYLAGLTGNLTIAGVWGLAPGQPIAMYYQQDAVGSRSVTFPAIMVGAVQPDPAPNAVSVQIFAFDAVTGKLRADGPLFSANGAFFAQGINAQGSIAAASANIGGAVAAGSVSAAGAITAATASVGSIAAASAAVSGLLTAGSANVAGAVNVGSIVAGSIVTGSLTLTAPGSAGQVLTNVDGVFVPQPPASFVSGSNANGSYRIAPDGTIECWGVVTLGASRSPHSSTSWIFPQAFSVGAYVQATLLGYPDNTNTLELAFASTASLTTSSVTVNGLCPVPTGGGGANFNNSVQVQLYAIGK